MPAAAQTAGFKRARSPWRKPARDWLPAQQPPTRVPCPTVANSAHHSGHYGVVEIRRARSGLRVSPVPAIRAPPIQKGPPGRAADTAVTQPPPSA